MKLVVNELNEAAVKYCGTVPEEGVAQLECLKSIGLKPHHTVLDIGCGALVAGIPIMDYLKRSRYYGIDPNRYLADATNEVPENHTIIRDKWPRIIPTGDFLAKVDFYFDYVISHSVISHVSYDQLSWFLQNTSKMLKPDGFLLFSAILVDGLMNETIHHHWEYPGSVFISRERMMVNVVKHFGLMEERPEMTKRILESHPSSYHDWILLTKPKHDTP